MDASSLTPPVEGPSAPHLHDGIRPDVIRANATTPTGTVLMPGVPQTFSLQTGASIVVDGVKITVRAAVAETYGDGKPVPVATLEFSI